MTPPAPSPPSVPFALPVRVEPAGWSHVKIIDADGICLARVPYSNADYNSDITIQGSLALARADAIVRALNAFYCPSAQATEREESVR